jgi:hypothetical protein
MYRKEELRAIVVELIQVLREGAIGLEKLTDHLARRLGHLSDGPDLAVARSELSALHVRAKKLVDATTTPI